MADNVLRRSCGIYGGMIFVLALGRQENVIMRSVRCSSSAILLLLSLAWLPASGKDITIKGIVTDPDGSAIASAVVSARYQTQPQVATLTDTTGRYQLSLPCSLESSIEVRAALLGYSPHLVRVSPSRDTVRVDITLEPNPLDLGQIVVRAANEPPCAGITYDVAHMESPARFSPFVSNPVATFRQPQLLRSGFSYSSKIRLHAASPSYYINGTEIGHDPHHYGMFLVLPDVAFDRIDFWATGTSARWRTPAVVNLKTDRAFHPRNRTELKLSLIEATALVSRGQERSYLTAIARESVLDKLLRQVPLDSDRRTIPPTRFRDLLCSSGVRLSSTLSVAVDQFHAEDDLSYKLNPTSQNRLGISTTQINRNDFVSVSIGYTTRTLNLSLRQSLRTSKERYAAYAAKESDEKGLEVELDGIQSVVTSGVEANFMAGSWVIEIGDEVNFLHHRHIELRQRDWNLLPPDASNDNPFIYQPELNNLYHELALNRRAKDNALYASFSHRGQAASIEFGGRLQYFGLLAQRWCLDGRFAIQFRPDQDVDVNIFCGDYSENPTTRITEPYQVLVHAWLAELSPLRSRLISLGGRWHAFKGSVFAKKMVSYPVVVPDFNYASSQPSETRFLRPHSIGQIDAYGGDVGFELEGLWRGRLNVGGFYAYSRTLAKYLGMILPHDLDCPHKFNLQASLKATPTLTGGAELNIRSGLPYTPSVAIQQRFSPQERYTDQFFRSYLATQNSWRLPANLTLNVFVEYAIDRVRLSLSLLNATNRRNPVIRTADGFIYDTGILPSLSLSISL